MVSVVGGVLAFAVLIGLTYRMARDADPTTALAAVAFVAIAPATSLEAVQGLETLFYAALVAGALDAVIWAPLAVYLEATGG